jgi:hypothetical protein
MQYIWKGINLVEELGLKVDDEGDYENPKDIKSSLEYSQCACVRLIYM